MKKAKRILTKQLLITLCTAVCAAVFAAGCTGEQNTIDEPEITVYYLTGEYAAQLIRDGAEVFFGTIDLVEDTDGEIMVDIREKEFVEDANHPQGFYIADRNLESTYYLSPEARATFFTGDSSSAKAMGYYEFVDAVWQELLEFGADDPGAPEHYRLYDIYIMGDEIQLLIARYFS